ncbi:MAG: filamentous hemagglutinin N-terminal domain-containing protein, partial [Candidatus Omnitrophica bacterium]|nr:filamentous hemagglutinin N-terminal domain-containing protein [Candidatus Omnitrophota bacterium]
MKIIQKIISLTLSSLLVLGQPFAYALPSGEQVQSGSASFDRSVANNLNITTSDKVIVNYNSFNIAQPETVRFIQPSSSSIALNRVVGGDPSSILGSLQSNGQVMLINPNGIIFGPNSSVDTGSFLASTLDISNSDFLSGKYNFAQKGGYDPSYIINQGHINASTVNGYVLLAAPLVVNEGTVNATTGSVNIAGTDQGTMSFDGRGLVNFAIPQVMGHRPGTVTVPTSAVSDIVKQVVNTKALVEAGGIVEE